MKFRVDAVIAAALIAVAARPARAQNVHDFAPWLAMMSTPYGSLPPVVTRKMAGQSMGVALGVIGLPRMNPRPSPVVR